jgi:hypothetical protein
MTSVADWAAQADPSRLRSSVASKRFPLSNEQLARFRFARLFSRVAGELGPTVPIELAEPICGFA